MRVPTATTFLFCGFVACVAACSTPSSHGGGGATSSAVEASSSSAISECGNGIVEPGETCDDGNTYYGDGCNGECQIEPGWSCSGEPTVCVPGACGNGLPLGNAKPCDDGNTNDGDGCSATCQVEPGYTCTGKPSVCVTKCGDGVRTPDEACDDGNLVDGDCCDSSCHVEPGCEHEPNDTLATAESLGTVSPLVTEHATISPVGDIDFFSFTISPGANVDLLIDVSPGILGTACSTGGPGIDSRARLYDMAGVELASDDDGGEGLCSRIAAPNTPPGVYYVAIDASPLAGANTRWDYTLTVGIAPTKCGNGVIDPGETCDDGNTTSGDGCSSTCQIECAGPSESEPNDDATDASGPLLPSAKACGAIVPAGDVDVWSFTVSTYSDVSIETFDASGVTCNGIDIVATLLAPDGTTELASADDGGVGACAFIQSTSAAGARHLGAGTYYVAVRAFDANAIIPSYAVRLSIDATCGNGVVEGSEECDGGAGCDATCHRIPVCGDGFVDPPEQCDDGNTVSGDGCSSTCMLERETRCNDGVDDDGNGLVDCADPACAFACSAFTCDPGDVLVAMSATGLPKPILDLQTAEADLQVATAGTVKRIAVAFGAKHSYDADIDAKMAAPSAPIIDLTRNNGGSGDDYTDTVFVDDPNACIIGAAGCGSPPFTGMFQPEGTATQPGFAAVIGMPAAGTWRFTVHDDEAGDEGSWKSLQLALCVTP